MMRLAGFWSLFYPVSDNAAFCQIMSRVHTLNVLTCFVSVVIIKYCFCMRLTMLCCRGLKLTCYVAMEISLHALLL